MLKARHLPVTAAVAAGLIPFTMAAPAAAAPAPSAASLQETRWVAMGDSFQSGVGTGDYYDDSGDCERSPEAHPQLLHENGVVPGGLDFVACSGAAIDDLYSGRHGEPPQMDAVRENSENISHVTVGIGGNDLDFASNLLECIIQGWAGDSCEERLDDRVQERFDEIMAQDPGTGLNKFQQVYTDIAGEVPESAAIAAITYPRFFPVDGGSDWTGQDRCATIRVSDQLWINNWIQRLNTGIADSAESTGALPIDLYDAPAGRELCNPDGNDRYLHAVQFDSSTFHPTPLGYQINADVVGPHLQGAGAQPVPAEVLSVRDLPEPPEARAEIGQDGDMISVDGSESTEGDGRIETYLWEFDDGELVEGESVTHTYEEEGTYHVTLTVIDANGEMGFSDGMEIVVG
ncbi:PKD domain-containing protein [Allosalinactinospora lopnorensis]|uniref:PKD domain-containing protein n=1 Tax=Allosalinactinospora lopnorensis TaxID=1352348 RepID=UPI000623E744|nr:PKD domain-containing protein [Allosalinactinospora lopnorensis]